MLAELNYLAMRMVRLQIQANAHGVAVHVSDVSHDGRISFLPNIEVLNLAAHDVELQRIFEKASFE
jgi:hypothetical protein